MKRTEMIQIIKAELLDWDNEVVCNDHLKMAESILNLIESAGMLPPFDLYAASRNDNDTLETLNSNPEAFFKWELENKIVLVKK